MADQSERRGFTPGPWQAVSYQHGYEDGTDYTWCVVAPMKDDMGAVIEVELGDWLDEPTARLIAAAPDLYGELKHLVRLLEPLERDGRLDVPGLATLNGARAALRKAEGREGGDDE